MTNGPKAEPAKILLRVPPQLRQDMSAIARERGRSLNMECIQALKQHCRAQAEEARP
jgi:predicted HicB family RNase H-like nuclease